MKKYLLSNWVNLLGTIIGFYLFFFIMAAQHLFVNNDRGFTFETVVLETLVGSIVYFYGFFLGELIPFLIYAALLLIIDYALFRIIKGNENLTKRLIIQVIIFSSMFIVYTVQQETFWYSLLPLTFILSQWLRLRKLKKSFRDNEISYS